jgi:hypothetical protein
MSEFFRRTLARVAVSWAFAATVAGCGEPAVQQGSGPPAEFQQKLVKEHPELFKKKVGKKYQEIDSIRERRQIIRQEWLKQQGQAQ